MSTLFRFGYRLHPYKIYSQGSQGSGGVSIVWSIALTNPVCERLGERSTRLFACAYLLDFRVITVRSSSILQSKGARLQEKLCIIEFTQSRSKHSNDNALVKLRIMLLFIDKHADYTHLTVY
ncbi:MAG: hypothetical protein K2P74_03390 [Nitrosomonas sp.]|nr:hypothetical protein [Nitrosomonas sp.]